MSNSGQSRNHPDNTKSFGRHAIIRRQLKAYHDGELSGWRHWLVDGHLSRCSDCQTEITQLKRFSDEMRNLRQPVPRPELRARILANLPAFPPQVIIQPRAPGFPATYKRQSIAGALCCLVLATLWAIGGRHVADGSSLESSAITVIPRRARQAYAATTPSPGTTDTTALFDARIGPSGTKTSTFATSTTDGRTPISAPEAAHGTASDQYTDPTSRAANELMNSRSDETDRAIAAARREFEQRQHLANAVVTHERIPPSKTEQSSLMVVVADVGVAQDRLRAVVQTLGGSLDTPTSSAANGMKSRSPVADQFPGVGAATGDSRTALTHSLITVRIPASASAHFPDTLRQIGTVAPWKPTINDSGLMSELYGGNTRHSPHAERINEIWVKEGRMKENRMPLPRPSDAAVVAPGPARGISRLMGHQVIRERHGAATGETQESVVLTVRLQAADRTVR